MTLSEIIMRLEKLDERMGIPGTDPQVVAAHLNDMANALFRLSVKVRKGES